MKIYTKTGDKGSTMLFGGTRVSKAHLRIDSYGTVDELNAYIGLLRDQSISPNYRQILKTIQDRLFVLGSHLATEPSKRNNVTLPQISTADITLLEQAIDDMEAQLPALKNFILPGGHTTVSFCHIARCVCRRTERLVVALADVDEVEPIIIQYLNRLSDYLFVLGRKLSADLGAEEIVWQP
jgi:cob(I)alamin adenosyltransferase